MWMCTGEHEWNDYGRCSVTCGGGLKRRYPIIKTQSAYGGADCPQYEEVICGQGMCPVDCVLTYWDEWSACSKTCGYGGTHTRTRKIEKAAAYGGRCPEESNLEETRDCYDTPCLMYDDDFFYDNNVLYRRYNKTGNGYKEKHVKSDYIHYSDTKKNDKVKLHDHGLRTGAQLKRYHSGGYGRHDRSSRLYDEYLAHKIDLQVEREKAARKGLIYNGMRNGADDDKEITEGDLDVRHNDDDYWKGTGHGRAKEAVGVAADAYKKDVPYNKPTYKTKTWTSKAAPDSYAKEVLEDQAGVEYAHKGFTGTARGVELGDLKDGNDGHIDRNGYAIPTEDGGAEGGSETRSVPSAEEEALSTDGHLSSGRSSAVSFHAQKQKQKHHMRASSASLGTSTPHHHRSHSASPALDSGFATVAVLVAVVGALGLIGAAAAVAVVVRRRGRTSSGLSTGLPVGSQIKSASEWGVELGTAPTPAATNTASMTAMAATVPISSQSAPSKQQ